MVCVCGAKLPVDNPSSCCDSCLRDPDEPFDDDGGWDADEDDPQDASNDGFSPRHYRGGYYDD